MKLLTRIILLSTAIVFPVKTGFFALQEASEACRKKRGEVERIEKQLADLMGGQRTPGLSPGDSSPEGAVRVDLPSAGAAASVLQPAEAQDGGDSGAEQLGILAAENALPDFPSVTGVPQVIATAAPPAPGIYGPFLPKEVSATVPPLPPAASTRSVHVDLTVKSPLPASKRIRVRLTFYSGKDDQWGSRVAWKQVDRAMRGRTVAADPAIFPYGTWIHVPGFGKLRVEDTGTAVKTRRASGGKDPVIDIYVGNEKETLQLADSTPHYVEITRL